MDIPESEAPPQELLARPLATEKQQAYITDLLRKADKLTPEIQAMIPTLDRVQVSRWIEKALKLPQIVSTNGNGKITWDAVPQGRYAIWNEEAGAIRFYHVDKPQDGRWEGYVFVKVQAGDDLHPIRNPQALAMIRDAIARDPKAASLAYGLHLGCCGVCGRTLTNPESIAIGIGPVCRERQGW